MVRSGGANDFLCVGAADISARRQVVDFWRYWAPHVSKLKRDAQVGEEVLPVVERPALVTLRLRNAHDEEEDEVLTLERRFLPRSLPHSLELMCGRRVIGDAPRRHKQLQLRRRQQLLLHLRTAVQQRWRETRQESRISKGLEA